MHSPKTLIVAEVGNIHDGSLGNCHAFIDAVADCGVDGFKFQWHIADAESSGDEGWPKRFQFHPQDWTRKDYWKRMEFPLHRWGSLCGHTRERGLVLIVSPFSLQAVQLSHRHIDMFKVASGEMNNDALLAAIHSTGKPVILSTGMSTTNEIDKAVGMFQDYPREKLYVLQCTTEYPCPPEKVGLSILDRYCRNICFQGGLSDHSGTIWPGIAAAMLNAAMIEVHVCWDKRQFGADASSSLTIEELRQLVEGVRFVEKMKARDWLKDELTATLEDVQVYREGKTRETFDVYQEILRVTERD